MRFIATQRQKIHFFATVTNKIKPLLLVLSFVTPTKKRQIYSVVFLFQSNIAQPK